MTNPLPVITIIGRPNVGKSTLFNAITGGHHAIVSDVAGTTRDSVTKRVEGQEYDYWLVDTAGLTNAKGESLEKEVQTQVHLAVEHADIVLLVVDGKTELTQDDEAVVSKLRKAKKTIVFVASKVDDGNPSRVAELSRLGFGMPLAVSGRTNAGLWELYDAIESQVQKLGFAPTTVDDDAGDNTDPTIHVALVGRPNVGKSSLFNRLVGKEKALVSDVAGTTRDAMDTEYTAPNGQVYRFIDTAGLRRRGKQKDIEFWGGVRTIRAVEEADVCVVLIDALDGVTHQDMVLIGRVIEEGKGLLLCVNKLDLVQEKTREEEGDERELPEVKMWGERLDKVREKYLHYLGKKLTFGRWAPIVFISAKSGKGVEEILPSVQGIAQEHKKRVGTSELNRYLPEIIRGHVPPSYGHHLGKVKYMSQVATCPPKFLFHVNNAKAFHHTYRRYLENKLREKYGFHGTPVQVEIRDEMDKKTSRRGSVKPRRSESSEDRD